MNDERWTMNDEQRIMNRGHLDCTPSPTLPPGGGGKGWGGIRIPNSKGMTTIEVIVVMILIGIVAAVVIPRVDISLTSGTSVDGAAYIVASDIRYVQECAMADRVSKSITFTASQNFYAFPATIPSTSKLDPSGRLPSGVTTLDNLTITFNSLGEPTSIAPVAPYYVDVRVSAGGPPKTIRIWCFTGKVEIL